MKSITSQLEHRILTAVIVVLGVLVPMTAVADDDVMDGTKVKIVKVVNGHELEGKLDSGQTVTVRVMGIDCPDGKPGKSAVKAAKSLLKKTVTLESTHTSFPLLQDNRGRLVAYVRTADGKDMAAAMLEKGQCTGAMWKVSHPRQIEYAQLSH